jgi:soluble lytic murein transglycosylase-like protein
MVASIHNPDPRLIGIVRPAAGDVPANPDRGAFPGEAAFESLLKQALASGGKTAAGGPQDQAALARTLMERMQVRAADRLLRLFSGSEAGETGEQDGMILGQLLELTARLSEDAEPRPLPAAEENAPPAAAAGKDSRHRAAALAGGDAPGKRGAPVPGAEMTAIIEKAARRYGVDPLLVRCVVRAESGFRPGSTSPKGAMGLMQLMPGAARDLGVRNAYDPEENVLAGTRYLKSLLDRYGGDTPLALAAYNWGMGNVDRRPDRLPEETRRYVAGIMRDYRQGSA